jgi:hypothetical protein
MSDPRYNEEASENENLCDALYAIANALRQLGFGRHGGDAYGPGAIEGHTMLMRDEIVPALSSAIEQGLSEIAGAIERHGEK